MCCLFSFFGVILESMIEVVNRVVVPVLFIMSALLFIMIVGMLYNFNRNLKTKTLVFVTAIGLVWCAAIAVFLTPGFDLSIREIMPKVYYSASAFLPVSMIFFADAYSKKPIGLAVKGFFLLIAVSICIYVCFPATTLFRSVDAGSYTVELNKIPYLVYTIYFVSFFLISMFVLLKNYSDKNLHRKQRETSWRIFIPWVAGGVFGSIFNLWLPWAGNYSLIALGPLSVLIFIPILIVAATTNEYLSAPKIFLKGLTGCFSLMVTVFSTIGILLLMNLFLPIERKVDYQHYPIYAIAFAIGILWAVAVFRLNRVLIKQIDSDGYNEEGIMEAISVVLAEKREAVELFGAIRHTLDKSFGVKQVDIVIFDENTAVHVDDTKLESVLMRITSGKKTNTIFREEIRNKLDYAALVAYDIEAVTPIIGVVHKKVIGVILLSPRKRKFSRYYGETLERVAKMLSPFIQSAVFYEQISSFNTKLKQEVRIKTRKLRENNKELMKLDEMKSDLLTIASHNLRTPLTGVLGYADMLREGDAGKLSKGQKEYIEEIIKSANNMNRVLLDFLDATRIDTGKFGLRKEEIDFSRIVDGEMEMLEEMAKSHEREIVYSRDKEDIHMVGDSSRLRQTVTNLVDNAIYYSKSKVEVNLHRDGNLVKFTVKDDGIGVPRDEQNKLFTKMYRASNAELARPDGSGIGLYVVKNIIEASGGKIIFESKEGKGSTFGFELRLGEGE